MFARDKRGGKRKCAMGEPTIVCPSCSTEIKLTESLAAPLIQATREEYEAKIARREADISKREAAVKALFHVIEQAKHSIDEQVAEKLRAGRAAAVALRQTLIEVAIARQTQEGQETKMELMYEYLTGPRFRHRIEAIVENFSDMQADLQRERSAMTRLWAKRETQILKMIGSTIGMYGDLQGIAGKALKEIDGLEVPLLPESIAAENCSP